MNECLGYAKVRATQVATEGYWEQLPPMRLVSHVDNLAEFLFPVILPKYQGGNKKERKKRQAI